MKVLGRLILFIAIVVPIVVCCVTINKVWSDEEDYENVNNGNVLSGESETSGDKITSGDESGKGTGVEEVSGELAGEQYISKIGTPISKIYTDATVAITVANVYDEADENSEVVGTIEKFSVITAHKYPEGWSRVTNGTISGWMRTENINFPTGGTLDTTGKDSNAKTGKVTAKPYLNMRASANTSAKIITTIPEGTTVTIKESTNGWYKVTYASSTGWVSSSYVKLDD